MKKIEFSDFGKKLSSESGILSLMDDLGKPLPPGVKPRRMGGGNPARIPEIEAMYRQRFEEILKNGDEFERVVALYDSPQGRVEFIEIIADFFSKEYGWKVTPENIAITNGSQSAFFFIFNLLSGSFSSTEIKSKKKILLPLIPEYTGYADQGIERGQFVGIPSTFTYNDDNTFKYHVDFSALEAYLESGDGFGKKAAASIGAICVSRPTNPTGNVLTNDEISRLASLAAKYAFPLMIDNAYGLPWPDIIFADEAEPYWDENTILSMSLSKIGLPTLRTGIIIASKEIVKAVSNINAIVSLASGSLGQAVAGKLIQSGEFVSAAKNHVRPFYLRRANSCIDWTKKAFNGTNYYLHKSEGSIFQWLLLPDLKITTKQLYKELKERGVIVVPGEYFFFGDSPNGMQINEHPHYSKCLRINYSGDEEEIQEGIKIIAELYKKFS